MLWTEKTDFCANGCASFRKTERVVNSQDTFVGCLSILLGCLALAGALSGGRLLRWSRLAQLVERRGGAVAVAVIYGALGIFLIGVGISLLK